MPDSPDRLVNKIFAVSATILGRVVREKTPDILFADRPQQGVGDGMQQNVGIAVTDRMNLRGDVDAADFQRSTVAQLMEVVTESNSKWRQIRVQVSPDQ